MTLYDRLKKKLLPNAKPNTTEELSRADDPCSPENLVYQHQLNLTDRELQTRVALLTPREHQLFLLLLEGFMLKEATKQLAIKYSTVNTHTTSIYKKLGVNSRTGLIINYHHIGSAKGNGL